MASSKIIDCGDQGSLAVVNGRYPHAHIFSPRDHPGAPNLQNAIRIILGNLLGIFYIRRLNFFDRVSPRIYKNHILLRAQVLVGIRIKLHSPTLPRRFSGILPTSTVTSRPTTQSRTGRPWSIEAPRLSADLEYFGCWCHMGLNLTLRIGH